MAASAEELLAPKGPYVESTAPRAGQSRCSVDCRRAVSRSASSNHGRRGSWPHCPGHRRNRLIHSTDGSSGRQGVMVCDPPPVVTSSSTPAASVSRVRASRSIIANPRERRPPRIFAGRLHRTSNRLRSSGAGRKILLVDTTPRGGEDAPVRSVLHEWPTLAPGASIRTRAPHSPGSP